MKTSVYIATSLDGFIARRDGSLDWLPGADGEVIESGEDYGYQEFMASVDTLVIGAAYVRDCAVSWPMAVRR